MLILGIFAATYAGIALGRIPGLKLNRVGIVLLGAIALMVFTGQNTAAMVGMINWPTIFLLFGFFIIAAQLRLSGFYNRVGERVARACGTPRRFLFILMAVAAILSAFLNNDITCFVLTPIVGAALLRQRINPVPFLVALAIACNFGAGATLIGNPQNMLIAQVAHLRFGPYMLWAFAPVVFALGSAYTLIWLLSRHRLQIPGPAPAEPPQQSYAFDRAHTAKGLIVLLVVIGLFFSSVPKEVLALGAAGIHLASRKFATEDLLALVDWPILLLFMGLFVVTGSLQATGFGEQAVAWLAHHGFDLNLPHNVILATTALTNLISNTPAVMLMLKVTDLSHPGTPYLLALANSFGGSVMIIGSVANLIVIQQARAMNIRISFWDFARLGIPATLAALAGLVVWVRVIG